MTEYRPISIPHWAACRKPDMSHKGIKVWRAPHDRERVVMTYWYSTLGAAAILDQQFDVRDLPRYVEKRFSPQNYICEQNHHFGIIRASIDDGSDMLAISLDARAARDAARTEFAARNPIALDADIPF